MMNIPKLAFVPVLALILTLIVLGVKGPVAVQNAAFGALMCITVIFAIIGRKPNAEKAEHE